MENLRVQFQHTADAVTLLGGVTVIEQHLRADIGDVGDDEYTHVNLLAETAIRYVEQVTGRNVENKKAIVEMHTLKDRFEVPFRIQRLTGFSYLNENFVETAVTTTDAFTVHKLTAPGVLELKLSYAKPDDYALDHPYPYKLTFDVAGDVDILTDNTTQTSRLFVVACLMYLAHLYENREAVAFSTGRPHTLPLAFESMVKTLKRIR